MANARPRGNPIAKNTVVHVMALISLFAHSSALHGSFQSPAEAEAGKFLDVPHGYGAGDVRTEIE
jgi:hypothetical protein